MEWRDFHEQALRDFKSSAKLYDDNDYGNSLFLLQQSVEKEIKSFVLKFKLSTKTMYVLKHEPLRELFGDLMEDVRNQVEKSSDLEAKSYLENTKETLEKIKEFFKKVENEFKITIWKESLGIPLNENESNNLKDFYNELYNSLETPFKQISAYSVKTFENKLKPFIQEMHKDKKREIQNLIDELKFKIDLDVIPQAKMAEVTMKDFQPALFFRKFEKLLFFLKSKDPRKMYHLNSDIFLIILLAWVFGFMKIILSVYVHESYGRYPENILGDVDKKSSLIWYKERSSSIPTIRKEVEGIMRRMDFILLNDHFLL